MNQQKKSTWLFITLLVFSLVVFLLDRGGVLLGVRGFFESMVAPISQQGQKLLQGNIKEEKAALAEKLAQMEELKKENEALRAQLSIAKETELRGQKLLPAHVLSSSRFFIIDRGSDDGVVVGSLVIFKNILVGKVLSAGQKVSRVILPTDKGSIIEVKTKQTNALGLVRGEGDDIIFSDVILSENLTADDTVVTAGSLDEKGQGILPNLVIGTVVNVRKSPNGLFQEGKVEPALDFKRLENVFVVL